MTDVTGAWSGIFNYPADLPATAFAAVLREHDGAINGEIDEPDIFSRDHAPLGALVDGHRDGANIRFTKFYDAEAEGYDVVHYHGTITPDSTEIVGSWDIPGAWSGTFIMTRESGARTEADVAESVMADDAVPAGGDRT